MNADKKNNVMLKLAIIIVFNLQAGVFCVKEIGAACDPTSVVSECGKNAFCFRMPACHLGVCLCRTPKYRQLWFRRSDCGLVLNEDDDCTAADPGLIPAGAICLSTGRVKCVQLLLSSDGVCSPKMTNLRKLNETCNDSTAKCDIYDGLRCMTKGDDLTHERRCECLPSYQLAKSETKCHLAKLGEWCQTDDECNAPYAFGSMSSIIRAAQCRPENSFTPTCTCNATGNYTAVHYSLFDPYQRTPNSRLVTIGRFCVLRPPEIDPKNYAGEGQECSIAIPQQASFRRRLIPPPFCQRHLLCYHCPEYGNIEPFVGRCFDPKTVLESSASAVALILTHSWSRNALTLLILLQSFIAH